MKDLTLSIILNLSTKNIAQGLKNFKSQFRKSMKETEDVARASSRELDAAFATLGMRSLKEVQNEIKRVKVAYETLQKSGQLSAREQAKAQVQLKKRVEELENELNGWAKNLSSIKENWLALVGLFGGAGYAISRVTKVFIEFDDVMRQVAAVSGANAKQFQEMTALAREMGATTRYSASEAAGALKYLAMAGFGVEKSMKSLPEVLNLASATATGLAQSADIVTNIMTQYGIQAEKLSHVNDVLVKATTSTNSNLVQLGFAFSYAGATAKTVGLTFEETVAILGQLHNAGIKGERAGTALRGALSRLLNSSNEAKRVLEELGVAVYDNAGKMRPFLDILESLQKAGATAADVMTIFGQEAGPGIQSLLNMGVPTIRQLSSALASSQGTAKKASEMLESGLGGSLRELRSAAEELKLVFGESLVPALTGLIKSLTFISRGLGEMDAVSKALVGTFTVAIGATVAWRLAISKLYNSFILLRTSILATTGAARGLTMASGALVAIWGAYEVGRLVSEMISYKEAMDSLAESAARYASQAEKFKEFKSVEIKTAEELKNMTQEEVEAYKKRLTSAMRYWGHLEASLIVQKEERNIFLQKTEAAKKAEEQYEMVSQKAEQYQQALRRLIATTKQLVQESGKMTPREFRAFWQATQQTIDKQTESFKEQLNKLQQDHEFRKRLLAAMQEDSQRSELSLMSEQKAYYSQLRDAIKKYYTEQSKSIDEVLAKEAELSEKTVNYQEQILRKKISVANTSKQALLSALDEALQKERQYAQSVNDIRSQIVSAQQSLEDELRALKRSRLSEDEQVEDKLAEAYEKQRKAREELERGNYELTKKYAEESKRIFAEVARTTKDKFDDAYRGVKDSGNIYIESLRQQKEEAEKKLEEQKALTQELKEAVSELNENIKDFAAGLKEIPEEKKTTILFNESGLSEIKKEYDEIKDKSVSITYYQKTIEAHQSGGVVGLSRGGKLPGFGGGDKIRALLEAGEFVVRKEAVQKYGVGLLSAINGLRLNLPSIPAPDVKKMGTTSHPLDAKPYHKFEINIGGAKLEGFAIQDVIAEFERQLRRKKLCGA